MRRGARIESTQHGRQESRRSRCSSRTWPKRSASTGTSSGFPLHFEDGNSAVFRFGDTLVNLLDADEAPSLVAPAAVATPGAGVRFQFTLGVDDVDAMAAELASRGVELLNGPMDRPWGIRTASFRDPGGHIWEIAS